MEWTEIIIGVISAILTALASWGVSRLIALINSKIENDKAATLLTDAVSAVYNAVKATYQTYVEALKGTEAWTGEAQKKALSMALETAKSQMSQEALNYLEKNYGDITEWLTAQVEAILYDLKNESGNSDAGAEVQS